jgi:hypothetical protein
MLIAALGSFAALLVALALAPSPSRAGSSEAR